MAAVASEARRRFSGRWSLVGFGGAGVTRRPRDRLDLSQNIGSGVLGLRCELARKFGLPAGVDPAQSAGTTALNLQVGNA
jgi:hypothetical protein